MNLPHDGETILIRDNITAVYSRGKGWLVFKIDVVKRTSAVAQVPFGSILGVERAVQSGTIEWR